MGRNPSERGGLMKKPFRSTFLLIGVLVSLLFLMSGTAEAPMLCGHVRWSNGQPVLDATIGIGVYSTTTNKDGYYEIQIGQTGTYMVRVSPPGRRTRSFQENITTDTTRDFEVNW